MSGKSFSFFEDAWSMSPRRASGHQPRYTLGLRLIEGMALRRNGYHITSSTPLLPFMVSSSREWLWGSPLRRSGWCSKRFQMIDARFPGVSCLEPFRDEFRHCCLFIACVCDIHIRKEANLKPGLL